MDHTRPRYDTIEISARTSLPLLIIRLIAGFMLLLGIYIAYLLLFDRFESPLKSGGIIIFVVWQFVQFAYIFYSILKWFCRYYEMTEKEVILHRGVIFQERRYYSLDKVESVVVNRSLLGRLLNYGTIHLTLYYSDAPIDVCLDDVPSPQRYERILQKNLRDFGHRRET